MYCDKKVYNINAGHNEKLMAACKRLSDYSVFVAKVREGIALGMPQSVAIQTAVDYCIEHGILEDILRKNREEVLGMFLEAFDEKKYGENTAKKAQELLEELLVH